MTDREDGEGEIGANANGNDCSLTFTVEDAIDKVGYGKFQLKLLFIIGFAWMADSMEITILAIMSPAIRCEWDLSTWEEATISTVVFAGMTISTCFWGFVADKCGRKKELIWCTILIFFGGFLSTFSPTYIWMVAFRGIVGLGLGGVAQAANLWLEFLPLKNRGGLVTVSMVSWSIGTCIEVGIAVVVMPNLGWRWLLLISSLPLIALLGLFKFIPESPRFLVSSGQFEKALTILQSVANENKEKLPPGKLVASSSSDQKVARGSIVDLFSAKYRRSTFLLWLIWFSSHFVIYGIALITTEMFSREDKCRGIIIDGSRADKETGCKILDTNDYLHYFVIMSSDMFGIVLCLATIDKIGRKNVQALAFAGSAIFLSALFICTRSRFVTTSFLYGARLFISIADLSGYVYTPEVYPTSVRGIGLGACNGVARIGCMITPFVAMVLMPAAVNISLSLYLGFAVLGVCAALLLPIETKGRALQVSLLLITKYTPEERLLVGLRNTDY
ncbi:synaptic vesicle 2-related protein-like isoform X2 [Actinia tenebrosa]|uniref:Synaptic vesicle 2-related protein-like isoform X2 n=1 Tax=Actinia tenebrosa TaxID=6105 RepID=A0A6P8H1H0_ACTTE|nr:synaptic vesicle 2-related protein-like isoform X2 [Actinia tenebrosa]